MKTSGRLSIWLFPSAYAPHIGGIERVVADLAHGLQDAGHNAVVVTNRYPRTLPTRERIDDVEVFRFAWPAPSRSARQTFMSILPALRTLHTASRLPVERPDLIHVQGLSSQSAYALALGKMFRVPLVLTTHGEVISSVYQAGGVSRWSRYWSKQVISASKQVITPSQGIISDYRRSGVHLPEETVVIPNGIDPGGWSGVPAPPRNSRIVGAWGRLSPEKGFDLLLDVWPLVRERVPDAQLWIAGAGAEEMVLRKKLSPGAELIGPRTKSELCRNLLDTRVIVIPSRHEPFGLVGLEAVATGRTVVYSAGTGLEESVGNAGVAVDSSNPDQLAQALIEALTTSRPVERRFVRAAEDMVRDNLDVYERVLGKCDEL